MNAPRPYTMRARADAKAATRLRVLRAECVDVNGYCTLVIDDDYSAEFQKIGEALSMDDVRHILRELRFTSLTDQSAWKPVGG